MDWFDRRAKRETRITVHVTSFLEKCGETCGVCLGVPQVLIPYSNHFLRGPVVSMSYPQSLPARLACGGLETFEAAGKEAGSSVSIES